MCYYGMDMLLFGMEGRKEGGRVVWHVLVLVRDIMFLPCLSFSSAGVAGTMILSFASVKIYILFTLLFTLYTHPFPSHNLDYKV